MEPAPTALDGRLPGGAETPFVRGHARQGMAASSCPECDGRVRNAGGTDYVCRDCGAEFDTADLFLP